MRRLFALLIFLLSSSAGLSPHGQNGQQSTHDWENPRVFDINKEPARATFVPYPDEQSARRGALAFAPGAALVEGSPFVRSLNGMWKFHWVKEPSARPADFYKPEYDVS